MSFIFPQHTNLIRLARRSVSLPLENGLVTLSIRGKHIVSALHTEMYKRLNMTITHPTDVRPLSSWLGPSKLISRIAPLVAPTSSNQVGFYIT